MEVAGKHPMENSHPIASLCDKYKTAQERAKIFTDIFKAKTRKKPKLIDKLKEGELSAKKSLERYFGSKGKKHEYSTFYKTLLETDEYIQEFCELLEGGVSHQIILELFNAWINYESESAMGKLEGREIYKLSTVQRIVNFADALCVSWAWNWWNTRVNLDESEKEQIIKLSKSYSQIFKMAILKLPWDVEEEMVPNKQLAKSINSYRRYEAMLKGKGSIPKCILEELYRIILKEVDWQLFSLGKEGSLAQRIVTALKERIKKSKEMLLGFNEKEKVNELCIFSFVKGIWENVEITSLSKSPFGLWGIGEEKAVLLEHVLVTRKGKSGL